MNHEELLDLAIKIMESEGGYDSLPEAYVRCVQLMDELAEEKIVLDKIPNPW
jgi:hypothetical protein